MFVHTHIYIPTLLTEAPDRTFWEMNFDVSFINNLVSHFPLNPTHLFGIPANLNIRCDHTVVGDDVNSQTDLLITHYLCLWK